MNRVQQIILLSAVVVAVRPVSPPNAVAASSPPPRPVHIMSMNMCTDMILLELVPKDRIASVTYLAHGAVQTTHPGVDQGVAINHGAAEDIAAEKPDLIFAGDFSTPVAKRLARRVGAPLLEVRSVNTFDDIRIITRQMAKAVGEPGRGEAMIAQMDEKLAWLAAHPPRQHYSVAAWSGGSVPGKRTLANDIIQAAGAINVASRLDSARYNTFGVEELLKADPDILIYGDAASSKPALHSMGMENAAVRARWQGRTITYPEALFSCGVPQSADAAILLRKAFDHIGARPRS